MAKHDQVHSAPSVLLRAAFTKFAGLPAARHFSNWMITARLIATVTALALPLNLLVVGVIWDLAGAADDAQRASLLYAARSVAAAVDAELGKHIALAQALSHSPALLDDNLDAFDAEARRSLSSISDASFWVTDSNGQQLINGAAQPGQPLPHLHSIAMDAQDLAFERRSVVVSDVLMGSVSKEWGADICVPIFKNDQPFRTLAVTMRVRGFLKLLNAHELPKNWKVGVIDGQGRLIVSVPDHALVGELAPQGWRDVKDRDGIFEFFHASEGDIVANASAHPALSGWTVGVAVKKSELQMAALNAVRKSRGQPEVDAYEFFALIRAKMTLMQIDESFLQRGVNEGFSGGEKKRNEILQMLVLEPRLAVLDETDSGLDIDALKVVARGIETLRSPDRAIVLVTHYQRLLEHVAPDRVHVLSDGRIARSGDSSLAHELEARGYEWVREARAG